MVRPAEWQGQRGAFQACAALALPERPPIRLETRDPSLCDGLPRFTLHTEGVLSICVHAAIWLDGVDGLYLLRPYANSTPILSTADRFAS